MLQSSGIVDGTRGHLATLAEGRSRTSRSAIMATVPPQRRTREIEYPTSDWKPMAETDIHRRDMTDVIEELEDHFADRPRVYVSGNLVLYYEEGNPRKHVVPDVVVALNVPKEPPREHYLVWKEGKAPDFVAEITSKTTRREDLKTRSRIYRDIVGVREYILFDPRAEYLDPPLQGYRLAGGEYLPIELVAGRLPGEVLGLHLERDGQALRLFDPATGARLLTRLEGQQAERRRAEAAEAEQRCLAGEIERLRREIEALRGG
jgi:Uma2 family endonuclease